MTRVYCLLLVCVTSSCSHDDGYAVDLTVIADPSLAEGMVAAIRTLDVKVTGAESYDYPVPITNQLTSGELRIIYRPGAPSGTLNFSINALDANNELVAHGETDSVTLKPGATVQATVTLTGEVAHDLGGDAVGDSLVQLPDVRPPDGGWVMQGGVATLGAGGSNGPFRLADDGLEIGDISCNASFCIAGGITP